jgi:hypothetical protein
VAGLQYGPPIDFRGLRHAPINEQVVVFLFGMVSYKLGFIVEAVHASFPDCETKRSLIETTSVGSVCDSNSSSDHGPLKITATILPAAI